MQKITDEELHAEVLRQRVIKGEEATIKAEEDARQRRRRNNAVMARMAIRSSAEVAAEAQLLALATKVADDVDRYQRTGEVPGYITSR